MRIAAFPKGDLHEMVVRRTKPVFEWIEEARTLGVDGLELHTGFLWDSGGAYLDRVGEAITDAGFAMPMMCASPDFTHPDRDERAREVERHASHMRATARLGGPGAVCRVLSGQAHPEVALEQGLDWAAEAITSLLPLAAELGIRLAIENHYKATGWAYVEFAQAPDVFRALLARIPDREHFGVQFDPSNALVAGADPPDFLRSVVDRVITMQASDRYREPAPPGLAGSGPRSAATRPDGAGRPGASASEASAASSAPADYASLKHGVIGQGLNDYDKIFSILVDAGYDGWISIEDGVNGLDELAASAAFLREARDRWFGGSTEVRVRALEAYR
ncbi:sugar phosphate isomerase/epimerase family protein [Phytohabitans houttuyneae]|uniref:Myo-inositol catabolism protein IolH n=1 Tax=Phytohabitans houttuyneae TaxID=1076126 RepID=A0A6V8KU89_9ACTN|nr:sugar phosphate isomerase/epimerase family protein [Phytohabitans houttuyneae]GFJ85879.1 myo-inositol catabolism protein IolH [Phytohabitans houttuyneae]